MDTVRIAELLQPFLASPSGEAATLSQAQLHSISTYIDLLLRWNARINLTSVRQPEAIVTRHFGESLFAALHLFPSPKTAGASEQTQSLIDVGSGAGFPGVPIKLWAPELRVTLIEANHKKATFLKQLARTLTLTNINVVASRAEAYRDPLAEIVSMRAVERFSAALETAIRLVATGGRIALLIGEAQISQAKEIAGRVTAWDNPSLIPDSAKRVLLIGRTE